MAAKLISVEISLTVIIWSIKNMLKDLVVSVDDSYARFKDFNGATNCVAVLYMRAISGFLAGRYEKIIIDVTPNSSGKKINSIDVLIVPMAFDFDAFWSVQNKKRFLFEFINSAMLKIAGKMDWNLDVLKKAYDSLKSSSLDLFLEVGKKISSPNRKLKCQLGMYYEMEYISLVLKVFDAKTECLVRETEIVRTPPHEVFVAPYCGRLKWRGSEIVLYTSLDGRIQDLELSI